MSAHPHWRSKNSLGTRCAAARQMVLLRIPRKVGPAEPDWCASSSHPARRGYNTANTYSESGCNPDFSLMPSGLAFSYWQKSTTAFADTAATTAPSTQPAVAAAPDPYALAKGGDIINPLNTVWTLVAAFLVFCMQAGFTMLEAGFCRSRETVNVLVECVFDTCLCGFLFYAFGYAFMFGQGNGFIGWHDPNDTAGGPVNSWFFLSGISAMTLYGTTGVPVLAHWIFQFAFAACASTICSGTMIG